MSYGMVLKQTKKILQTEIELPVLVCVYVCYMAKSFASETACKNHPGIIFYIQDNTNISHFFLTDNIIELLWLRILVRL